MKIDGKTTLAEIHAAIRDRHGQPCGPEFIIHDRTIRIVPQSMRVEGYLVTTKQIRDSAIRILSKLIRP